MSNSKDIVVCLFTCVLFIVAYAVFVAVENDFGVSSSRVDPRRVVVLVTRCPLAEEDHIPRIAAIKETWGAAYPHVSRLFV